MNRPEQELAKAIVRHLDEGAANLDAVARDRLYAARQFALSRYREQPQAAASLAAAGGAAWHAVGERFSDARHLIMIVMTVAALVGFAYWQSTGPANEIADIDSSLLSDELPIGAYLDNGFDSWLKRSPR